MILAKDLLTLAPLSLELIFKAPDHHATRNYIYSHKYGDRLYSPEPLEPNLRYMWTKQYLLVGINFTHTQSRVETKV